MNCLSVIPAYVQKVSSRACSISLIPLIWKGRVLLPRPGEQITSAIKTYTMLELNLRSDTGTAYWFTILSEVDPVTDHLQSFSTSESFQELRLALLALNIGIRNQVSHFLLPDFWPFCSLLCYSEAHKQEKTVVNRLISSREPSQQGSTCRELKWRLRITLHHNSILLLFYHRNGGTASVVQTRGSLMASSCYRQTSMF